MPKTLSPKVIAAYVLREVLTDAPAFTAAQMQSLVDGTVSEAKRDKVALQVEKTARALMKRVAATIHRFETPKPRTA